jgi:hypothetical protein
MNFSARKARRKWPYSRIISPGPAIMVTAVAALIALAALADPAAAARRPGVWPQGPWGGLFGERRPQRRAALPPSVPLPKSRPADAPVPEPEKPMAALPPSVSLPKPRPADAPVTEPEKPSAEPARPVEQAAPAPPPPSACRLALTEEIAIAPSIPDIYGPGGCGGEDLVRLEAVVLPDKHRVSLKPAAILRCTMASAIADWIRTDMVPLAASLGSVISNLDNFDSYECRGFNRIAGAHLSEHGRANALDVRGLKLADGQSISLTDRNVPREVRENVLHSVCARFTTVLGPGSDGYHEDHIHLDLMERHNNYKICQWNVWDPLPQIAPLLPAERPEEAPPREVAAKSDAARPDTSKTDTSKTGASKTDANGSAPAKPDAAKSDAAEQDPAEATPPTNTPPTKKRRQNRRF